MHRIVLRRLTSPPHAPPLSLRLAPLPLHLPCQHRLSLLRQQLPKVVVGRNLPGNLWGLGPLALPQPQPALPVQNHSAGQRPRCRQLRMHHAWWFCACAGFLWAGARRACSAPGAAGSSAFLLLPGSTLPVRPLLLLLLLLPLLPMVKLLILLAFLRLSRAAPCWRPS